ncbi:MAG: cytochrome c3 family protein [Actinomycetes bacterium]|jgi:hypothetical protein|nr:cytochrome c3 family protein [Actinomycetes bacterium]
MTDIGPFHIDWSQLTVTTDLRMDSITLLPQRIADTIAEPNSNPIAFALILSIAAALALIVAFGIYSLVTRRRKTRIYDTWLEETGEYDVDTGEPLLREVEVRVRPPHPVLRAAIGVSTGILIVALMWVATGLSTRVSRICVSCHRDEALAASAAHVAAIQSGVHKSVGCTDCHESGGWFTGAVFGLPRRLSHIVAGSFSQNQSAGGYTVFPESSCVRCHAQTLDRTGARLNADGTIRMDHEQPLAAGIACGDCHAVSADGQVGANTTGMSLCMDCHNGTVGKDACKTCHTRDTYIAAKQTGSPANAQRLVDDDTAKRCYNCHQTEKCDSCHNGQRMPHPSDYLTAGGGAHIADVRKRGMRRCFYCHENRTFCEGCHDVRDSW